MALSSRIAPSRTHSRSVPLWIAEKVFVGGLGDVEEGEEDAAEGGFAASGVVPFLESVDASSGASSADSYGGNT